VTPYGIREQTSFSSRSTWNELRRSLDGLRDAQATWGEIMDEAEPAISNGEEQFTASRRVADGRP
jgi:hypothetical protein